MRKALSKEQRQGLLGYIDGVVIRLSRGSETEFEALSSKLQALGLENVSDSELLVYAIVAGKKGGMPAQQIEHIFRGLYRVDGEDLEEALAHSEQRFLSGEFLD